MCMHKRVVVARTQTHAPMHTHTHPRTRAPAHPRYRWTTHHEHVWRHLGLVDEVIDPFLRTRINFPDSFSDQVLARRVTLLRTMDRLNGVIADLGYLSSKNLACSVAEVGLLWREYEATMLAQLTEAESVTVPLMRAYFMPSEIAGLNERMLKAASDLELGGLFHYIGGKADALDFITNAAWFLSVRPKRAQYRKSMLALVHSLRTGDRTVSQRPLGARATANILAVLRPVAGTTWPGRRQRLPPTPLGSRYPRGLESPKTPKMRKVKRANRRGRGIPSPDRRRHTFFGARRVEDLESH